MSARHETREREVLGALRRAATYRLLALAFAYPSSESLAELARLAAGAAADAPEAMRAGVGQLAEAARTEEAGALAARHVALFDGAVRYPLYEGAYGPPQMGGKAAQLADIAAFYEAFGLTAAGRQPELPDHIAAELEFMGVLALKEAWALGEDDRDGIAVTQQASAAFLADHLGRWGASFAARISGAGSLFHETAAALVATWLELEAARLGVTPASLTARAGVRDDAEPFTCPMAVSASEER